MRALLSVIQLALTTLRENKLRSFLTVLGVIIGTGTIIGVGSILTGFDGAVTGVLRSFGTDTLIVFKFQVGPRFGNLSAEERQRKPITLDDMEREMICKVMAETGGQQLRAADTLGISLRTLGRKLKQYSEEGGDL